MKLISFLIPLLLASTFLYSQTQQSQPSTPFNYFYRELPKNLLADAQETVHPLSLLIIGAATPSAISLSQSTWDQELQDRTFKDSLPGFLETTGNIGGSWVLFLGASLTSYGWGWWKQNPRTLEFSKILMEALILTEIPTEILKITVDRDRPDQSNDHSFPSGHTSAAFAAAATVEAYYGHRWGIPAFIAAGFIGYTRLSENKHYLSDMIAGAALGTTVGLATVRSHFKQNPFFTFTPYPLPNGLGVMFARVW